MQNHKGFRSPDRIIKVDLAGCSWAWWPMNQSEALHLTIIVTLENGFSDADLCFFYFKYVIYSNVKINYVAR